MLSSQSTEMNIIPPYGKRSHYVPRKLEDFGDGGAFPEIPVPQYPLDMGLEDSSSNVLVIHNYADENARTDMILKQGHNTSRIIFGRPEDANEKELVYKPKPNEDERAERIREVQAAFQQQLDKCIYDSKVVQKSHPKLKTDFIQYTPSHSSGYNNTKIQQRIIKMVDVQIDPMEPSRFKISKKIPRGPPSPPSAILSSPPRPATKQEKAAWRVPPCISNWKNSRGFTIPLATRVTADGRNSQTTVINEKINSFSEALFIAERKAREDINARNALRQKIANKEKESNDAKLRELALLARKRVEKSNCLPDDSCEERARNETRNNLAKARQREKNIKKAAPDQRNKTFEDRDISEKIALGQANPLLNSRKEEHIYDSRLMNKTGGLDSGFSGGADDLYNIYDTRLFNHEKKTYKAPRQSDLDELASVDKYQRKYNTFVHEKEAREEPVVYDKDDPFEINKFLSEVRGRKRALNSNVEMPISKRGRKDKE